MKNALLTLATVSPAHAGQCFDLIRHIEHGDAATFTVKAQQLIASVLESDPDMTDAQRSTLEGAIADYKPAEIPITIHGILAAHNLSQTALAKRFEIPLRTVQGWCNGTRKSPEYILRMMVEILSKEQQ